MTAAEVLTGGGIVLVAMTLIQISPIKLDPWSAIARAVGRAINKDVIDKLDETREILDAHIKMDGARTCLLYTSADRAARASRWCAFRSSFLCMSDGKILFACSARSMTWPARRAVSAAISREYRADSRERKSTVFT